MPLIMITAQNESPDAVADIRHVGERADFERIKIFPVRRRTKIALNIVDDQHISGGKLFAFGNSMKIGKRINSDQGLRFRRVMIVQNRRLIRFRIDFNKQAV